jgi:hypothetical protein
VEKIFLEVGDSGVCGDDFPSECYSVSYAVTAKYNLLFVSEFVNKARINVYYDKYRLVSQIPKSKSEDLFAGIDGILGVICYLYS